MRQRLQARQVLCRHVGFGLQCSRGGARLAHFLGTAARLQTGQRLLQGLGLRARLGNAQLQGGGVEFAQHLPGAHPVALLYRQAGDALTAIERQRYLAHVHIAVQDQIVAAGLRAHAVPKRGGQRGYRAKRGNDDFFVHVASSGGDIWENSTSN